MPELRNLRHEKMALRISLGDTRRVAAIAAGYRDTRNLSAEVSKICSRPEVSARITELSMASTAQAVAVSGLDKAWVIDRLKEVIRDGQSDEKQNLAAVNQALKLAGTELGMFVERHEIANLDGVLENKTTEELRMHLAQSCSEVGMRVVDMSDDATRDFILRNAERVGLEVSVKVLQ